MNSFIFPFSIHSDTITNCPSSIVTPRSGSTFGWLRAFHLIASLQNLYTNHPQSADTHVQSDLLFELFSSHSSSIPSGPWLRPAGLDSHPTTRPQTHLCTAALPAGHRKVGFGETPEVEPGGHIHGTKRSTISSGVAAEDRGAPKPNRK